MQVLLVLIWYVIGVVTTAALIPFIRWSEGNRQKFTWGDVLTIAAAGALGPITTLIFCIVVIVALIEGIARTDFWDRPVWKRKSKELL